MAKVFRVVSYILNLNGYPDSKKQVISSIENNGGLEFQYVKEVEETDCGEWDDDHELNQTGADFSKYFPNSNPGPSDMSLKREYERVRGLMLEYISKNGILERENQKLKDEVSKLHKLQEFAKGFREIFQ